MIQRFRETWKILTMARGGSARRSRSGIALLVVITTILVLTILVTDLTYGATVRFQVATHQRDRVTAVWLARSGVNLYRLLLTAGKQLEKSNLGSMAEEYLGINVGDQLWQMVPVLNTGLIRMIFASDSGGDVTDEDKAEFQSTGRVSDAVAEQAASSSVFSDKSWLDFDGDFSAEVTDEESKININKLADRGAEESCLTTATALQLYGLMSGEENDQWFHDRNLDRWELIANLADWVDADNTGCGPTGGYEDNLYNRGDSPYLAKNAPFDTKDEIRLVEGWQDEVFERFGPQLSVYGSGKININTADDALLTALIRAYVTPTPTDTVAEQILSKVKEQVLLMGDWSSPKAFSEYLATLGYTVDSKLTKALTKSSQTFTITSTGLSTDSAATVTCVVNYGTKGGTAGKVLYWRED